MFISNMFRGNTMVPFLLLLLLHESQADKEEHSSSVKPLTHLSTESVISSTEICVSISKSTIQINGTVANISDGLNETCSKGGFPCSFFCKYNSTKTINGSYCLNATETDKGSMYSYDIEEFTNCSLILCVDTTILPLIQSLDDRSSDQEEMIKLLYIRDSCTQLFTSNKTIKTSFLHAEKQIIHNIMRKSQLENGGSRNYNLTALSLNVINISDTDLNANRENSMIRVEVPQLLPQNMSYIPDILLPVSGLETIPAEKRVIGLVSYLRNSQFQIEQEKISSMVVRIEILDDQPLYNLSQSIQMIFRTFSYIHVDDGWMLQCHYLDEQDWQWKTDGCVTSNSSTETDVICYCNHTTPFAVLLIRQPITGAHWEILSSISYIGCGLSVFFTALSLVIYVFSWKQALDHSTSIHVSLSGALFLLNSVFLLTEWGATVEPVWVCVFIAAFMQYSLLSCFTWMGIEALHLYLMLIKVFNTYYKHYMVKLSLAGWGIPGVIVAITLGVKEKGFYGITHITMADTNQTSAFCWIKDDTFFYSLNLAYFSLIFMFNFGILVAVASSICKMKQVARSLSKPGAEVNGKTLRIPERFSGSCRNGLTVLGLTFLLGTSWGLAFLGSGYVNYPILYLFCILNSTQGFFIFLWICLSTRKQRRKYMEDKVASTSGKTTDTKTD